MSSRRHSLGGPPPHTAAESAQNLRQRVITCLNKLSDRDTLAGAAAELESIARTLSHDSFSSFLSCIHNTDSSSKSPVRKQCVHLLNILSRFHGEALSSFLPKMLATVLRRLRDTDSAVRSACVDAVAEMSTRITRPPFATAFLRPLMDALVQEQDVNTQIGAALCLAAAVEAAPDPDAEALRRSALPRLGKLVKSDVCRARAALLVLIGSVVAVGGASSRGAVSWLVPCLVEFLGSEDWTVRKAAAEALLKVASVEKDLASQHKVLCLDSLQNRRFDKIKVVRETMNRALETWREVTDDAPAMVKSECDSVCGSDYGKGQRVTKSSPSVGSKSSKTIPANRSPPSGVSFMSSAKGENFLNSNEKNSKMATLHKHDDEKSSVEKLEGLFSRSSHSNMSKEDAIKRCDVEHSSPTPYQNGANSRAEIKRVLFSKMSDEKVKRFSGSKSRVVPCYDDTNFVDNSANDVCDNPQDVEDFSLIREQLIQIENQQSNLLDTLQRFIGSSQSGMNSLESRVHGLEMALDEISYDLAVSSGRFSYTDVTDDTCCKLPGTDFLSSKFWKKTEGRYTTSKFSLGNIASTNGVHNGTTNRDGGKEILTPNNSRLQHGKGEYFVNQLAEVQSNFKGLHTYKMSTNRVQDAMRAQTDNASRYGGIHPATEAPRNHNVRSSV
ncbi:TORTIFOLIA1-like protein 4 isoform X2 [Vigna umbellata]|uniref:TORTIFOLIA1-like protein 4 isoform X1 n=1 Tax=Vigna umbellata TaxID=87088 RepID=UPI001F5F8188|nr:TORTIFOLIA1-like protein 4 isoform X1 [Vigna umbellata]XP_047151416.1 TORTIFOLIA1-like protein 4 isoform X2 [Vigna umbellata]